VVDVSATPVIYFVNVDHLNRPVRITNTANAVAWTATWLPWGGVHAITGTATLNARFPGQWFQLEAGLHYNWHRHYDPTIGRYTQPDPLGFVDGPSVYGYAKGSPIMDADFEGLQSVPVPRPGMVPIPPVLVPMTPENWKWAEDFIRTIRTPIEICSAIIVLMAQHGKNKIDNEYVRRVQDERPQDPCKFLRDLYDAATNPVQKLKIKAAQKRFDCDNRGRFQ